MPVKAANLAGLPPGFVYADGRLPDAAASARRGALLAAKYALPNRSDFERHAAKLEAHLVKAR